MDALDWSEEEIITRHKSWPEGTGLDRVVASPRVRMLGVEEALPRHLNDPLAVVLPRRPHVEPPTRKLDRAHLRREMARFEQSSVEIEVDLEDLADDDDVEFLGDDDLEVWDDTDPPSDVMPLGWHRSTQTPEYRDPDPTQTPDTYRDPVPAPPESFPLHRLSDLAPVMSDEPAEAPLLLSRPRAPLAPWSAEERADDDGSVGPAERADVVWPEPEPVVVAPQVALIASPPPPEPPPEPKVIIDTTAQPRSYADLPASWSSMGLPAPVIEQPESLPEDDWVKRSSSLAPLARAPRSARPQRHQRGAWRRALALAATALAGVGLVFGLVHLLPGLWQQHGTLRIDLASPNTALDGVFVDGQRRCDTTPCVVEGVAPGARVVKVVLRDRQHVLTQTLEVAAGVDNIVMMGPVTTDTQPVPPPAENEAPALGRLVVASKLEGVEVELDGKPRGRVPLTVADLPLGDHVLRFSAPKRKPVERKFRVAAHETIVIEDVMLALETGEIRITSATPGARVLLAPKNTRRRVLAGPFPKTFDVAPGSYDVIAIRPGYTPKLIPIVISDASPDVELTLELTPRRIAPRQEDIYE